MRGFRFYFFILLTWGLAACEEAFFEEEPSNTPVGNFESLWETFDEKYAVFEQRGIDWNQLYDSHRPLVNEQTSDEELYTIITSMLTPLDDGHVSLLAPEKPFWNAKEEFRTQEGSTLFNLFVVLNEYLDGQYASIGNQVFYGTLDSEIGYIFINHVSDPINIDGILSELGDIEGLVIDLRHNNGGDFTNGEPVAARFADERHLAFSGQPKNGPGRTDFGEITEFYIAPDGAQPFDGPIAVITSRYTVSAGENLVMYLNVLPNVTVFGEPTAGAMGERIEKEMPNGWIYSITGQIVRAADGISYEGPGIPPDIDFVNNQEDVENNVDSLFLTAVDHLRNQL